MIQHERRLSIRKQLEHIAYIGLPSNNGGIVTDVSEGGLGFHAIAPVQAAGPIGFRFAIDTAARINAVGELAWKDETGKTGGLRFTELPNDIREQIRVWADPSQTKAKATAKERILDIPVAEPAIGAEAAPSSKVEPVIEVQAAPGSKVEPAPVAEARSPLLYNSKPPIYSGPSNTFSIFPLDPNSEAEATYIAAPRSGAVKHPIAAVGLTIVLAFLLSIGIFSYVATSRSGELLYDWGEKIWGGSYSQPIPGKPASPASSAPDSSNTPQN